MNLIKSRERTPRESKLLTEYTAAINYLNQFLPEGKKIIHRAWDMSRAAKSRDQDVIGTLESIAEEVVRTTGFFHNGDGTEYPTNVQNGVARTNCIDCLDRTNAAQFVIGKRALGHQLHVLGILEDTSIGYDTDAVNLFTHMYHDHGDTIAMQYGGSQLVNTMETYRRINQWTSHSRDMIESFKRYYNNSFLDGQRQEAYNLFLGNYIFSHGQPMLWDLSTDYYLHHADPRAWNGRRRRDYTKWYTPEHLETRTLPPLPPSAAVTDTSQLPDDYWLEYYRPSTLSSFLKMFPYRMNSTVKYIPIKSIQEGRYDWSPFRVRSDGDVEASDRKKGRKDLAIAEDQRLDRVEDDASSIVSEKSANAGRSISIQRWLQPLQDKATPATAVPTIEVTRAETADVPGDFAPGTTVGGISGGATPTANGAGNNSSPNKKPSALDKSRAAQRTFRNVVYESLNPTVSRDEANDYAQYVSHPQSLPLVVSAADEQQPATAGAGATGGESVDAEYLDYVRGPWRTDPGWWSTSAAPSTVTADYAELLRVADNPLTVTEEDALKKRYKAYGKWLIGKSLFKQQPVD